MTATSKPLKSQSPELGVCTSVRPNDRQPRATTLERSDVYDPVSGLVISIWSGAAPGRAMAYSSNP